MRILFWNQLFLPSIGGVEILTARMAQRLIGQGHDVAVIANRHPASLPCRETIEGVEIYRFPFHDIFAGNGRDAIENFKALSGTIDAVGVAKKTLKPDVVHVNLSDAGPFFHLRTLKAWNCPTVVSFQAALTSGFSQRNGALRALLKESAALVAPSKAAAANVAENTGVDLDSIRIVPSGIPEESFLPKSARDDELVPTFVFLGRIVDYKGVDTAIEATALLNGTARLLIIGDGPQRSELEVSVKARRLQNIVSFARLVDDRQRNELVASGFALLVPSRHIELFGMVAVEAALCALPVIASNIGGLAEIVVPGETGYLVDPENAEDMAAAMSTLIGDRALARRMGEAGRQRARSFFTIDRTVDSYLDIYRDCVAAAPMA